MNTVVSFLSVVLSFVFLTIGLIKIQRRHPLLELMVNRYKIILSTPLFVSVKYRLESKGKGLYYTCQRVDNKRFVPV